MRDGDHYVVNGRKWWSSGAMSPDCALLVVMGKTDPEGPRHRQQSMLLVPRDTPGVRVLRGVTVFGYTDGLHGGHGEILFEDVRVPASYLLGGEGEGFAIAQAMRKRRPSRLNCTCSGVSSKPTRISKFSPERSGVARGMTMRSMLGAVTTALLPKRTSTSK